MHKKQTLHWTPPCIESCSYQHKRPFCSDEQVAESTLRDVTGILSKGPVFQIGSTKRKIYFKTLYAEWSSSVELNSSDCSDSCCVWPKGSPRTKGDRDESLLLQKAPFLQFSTTLQIKWPRRSFGAAEFCSGSGGSRWETRSGRWSFSMGATVNAQPGVSQSEEEWGSFVTPGTLTAASE